MATSSLAQFSLASKARVWLIGGVTLIILCLLAYWGGAAHIDARFWTGVLVLSALLLGFGGVTWWLFLGPAPATRRARVQSLNPTVRQLVAYLATISTLMFVTGATWDEAWHRR